ncbi:MAG: hypothetical protein HYS05_11040 [Acidobacteria bacterium]|nr:hypothetical protein [Acidobacteriota bacterium]
MLIPLTIVALAVAGVMTWMAWRVIREERQRSEARIAALAAEIGAMADPQLTMTPTRNRAPRTAEEAVARFSDTPLVDATERHGAELFSATARPPRRGTRWVTAAVCGALVFGLAIATVVTVSLRSHPRDASTSTASAVSAAQPLELVSLHHERTAERLVIRGLVRNPAGGKSVNRVSAVVFLFDRDGGFLTSGRALVDYLTLTPGEESPFVVEIPAAGSVGRYRVSFRNADGSVLPHVDRRAASGTADKPTPTSRSAAAARRQPVG